MSRPLRLGILGGAFDPVHVGHLFIASAVAAELSLDRVLFQPVGDPAHRTPVASSADRRAMVLLAIRGDDRFMLDETALRQRGPVYTADTMPLLRKEYPDASFLFIAGADSLIDTPWRRLDEVAAELDHFVVVERALADARRLAVRSCQAFCDREPAAGRRLSQRYQSPCGSAPTDPIFGSRSCCRLYCPRAFVRKAVAAQNCQGTKKRGLRSARGRRPNTAPLHVQSQRRFA